jgi:ankyrin repeat protein
LNVVEHLVKVGADPHAKTKSENSALHIASQNGSFSIVQFLVSKGKNKQ